MLPACPSNPIDADGRVAVGAYAGHTGPIDWRAAHRGPLWRKMHWKRWHYVSIAGPECLVAAAIIDLGWGASAFAYLFDRRDRRLLSDRSFLGLPGASVRVSDRAGEGARSSFRGPRTALLLERPAKTWKLNVQARGLVVEATLEETPASGTLCAVARIEGGVGNCTHKTSCLRAAGRAEADGRRFDLDGYAAALDHTNGLLARNTAWRWASASGQRIGLNLVEGFNGPVENAVWIDGTIRPVGAARFEFEPRRPLEPWRIKTEDGAVDLTFTPEGMRSEDRNLLVAASHYVQPVGTFSGSMSGERIEALPGVTEDHRAKW